MAMDLLSTLPVVFLPILLQQGVWMLATIVGRAAFTANKIHAANPNPFATPGHGKGHHFLVLLFTGYAGGFMCPILMGNPPVPLVNDKIPCLAFLTWVAFFGFGPELSVAKVYNLLPVRIIGLLLENIFKANLMVNFAIAGSKGGLGLIGGIMITALAGCGGVFSHFELEVIAKALPVPVHDALKGAIFVNLATRGAEYLTAFNTITLASLTLADVKPLAMLTALTEEELRVLLVLGFFFLAAYREFIAPMLKKEKIA